MLTGVLKPELLKLYRTQVVHFFIGETALHMGAGACGHMHVYALWCVFSKQHFFLVQCWLMKTDYYNLNIYQLKDWSNEHS